MFGTGDCHVLELEPLRSVGDFPRLAVVGIRDLLRDSLLGPLLGMAPILGHAAFCLLILGTSLGPAGR